MKQQTPDTPDTTQWGKKKEQMVPQKTNNKMKT